MITPAGWYPDPSGADGQRYFDGVGWTDHRAAPPVRRRRVWPWIVAAVLLLCFSGCGAFLVAEHRSISSLLSGDRLAVFGQTDTGVPFDDGSLRFVIDSVGKASLQSDPQPRGAYYVVDVTVTNTGTGPRLLSARDQTWIDARNNEYAAVGMSVVASRQESRIVVVNPGQVVEVTLRFDVPKERQVSAIESTSPRRRPGSGPASSSLRPRKGKRWR